MELLSIDLWNVATMTDYRSGEEDPLFYGGTNGVLPHLTYGATFDNNASFKSIYLTGQWSNPNYFYIAQHYDYGLPTGKEYFSLPHGAVTACGLDLFLQADGIVALGAFTLPDREGYFPFLGKVTRELGLVTSFGDSATPGYAMLGPASGVRSVEALDRLVVRVTPDRIYILAAGGASQPNQVICLDLQGRLDPAFNGTGMLDIIGQPPKDLHLQSLEIPEPYNRIILAGHEAAVAGAPPAGVFVGVTPDGTLDEGFGPGGFVYPATPVTGVEVFGTFLKHALTWAVVAVGKGLADSKDSGLLMSVNQDGSQDIDFNGGEPLLLGDELGELTWLRGAQDPRNGVIVGGYRLNPVNPNASLPAFGRIGVNGKFDATFGEGGVVTIRNQRYYPGTNRVLAMFVQTDNRVVVVGLVSQSGDRSFMLGYFLKDTVILQPPAATGGDSPLTSA